MFWTSSGIREWNPRPLESNNFIIILTVRTSPMEVRYNLKYKSKQHFQRENQYFVMSISLQSKFTLNFKSTIKQKYPRLIFFSRIGSFRNVTDT